jgi:hypothetical protein
MPDIYFPSHLEFMSGIYLVYAMHILSESFDHMLGIYLTYSSACESACRSNAIGMRLHTYFGRQGCLIFSAKRGRHAGNLNAGAAQDAALCGSALIVTVSMLLLQQPPKNITMMYTQNLHNVQSGSKVQSISKLENLDRPARSSDRNRLASASNFRMQS